MKAGKYSIKELFSNRYIHKIIIPEIQRDYVWGEEQVKGLLSSLTNDFKAYLSAKDSTPEIDTSDTDLKDAFRDFYQKRTFASSIGFIYAYSDEQYPGRYFLIDGQQRITTIYLIQLILACSSLSLTESFKATFMVGNEPKLDYKVRESAHSFMTYFIPFTLNNGGDFKDQIRYFDQTYKQDQTIQSILKNTSFITDFIKKQNISCTDFYYYIEHLVEFWYFDTNISEQGEELYLYMNARGESMQGNENIKAALLGKLSDSSSKNTFGKKWENWQDFFWKHRGRNPNADKGFNNFLSCISGLEYYLRKDKSKIYTKELFDKLGEIRSQDTLEVLSLEVVEDYIEGLNYLEEKKESFLEVRPDVKSWVNHALTEIWDIINNENINWFADYNDDNRATERNSMVYLWSILLFIRKRVKKGLTKDEAFRLVRIYYLRSKNNVRSVNNIAHEVEIQANSGIWKETTIEQERKKNHLLETCNPNDLREIEYLIWQIEDHELNLNGRDVGMTNISHIVDFELPITTDYLKKIKNKFYEIFPENDTSDYSKVAHVLLHYGKFYDQVSPYYYLNLKFNNWRRIIRGIGSFLKSDENPFLLFFNEFINFPNSFDDFIMLKDMNKVKIEDANSIRKKLLWYSQNLKINMWSEGNSIAISYGTPCSLPDWEGKDVIFTDSYKIYNTKGNLKGGSPIELSTLLKDKNHAITNQRTSTGTSH